MENQRQFISYLRVSTGAQGRSGLGLEAQRQSISSFISAADGYLLAEYQDVRSGAQNGRSGLFKAIEHAKKAKATLIIAKLDRVSRKVSFIADLMDSGIKFVVAELPNADEFQLHIYAALAQQERKMISERTKAALAAAKQRGVVLGSNGKRLAAEQRQKAVEFAQKLEATVKPLRQSGMTLRAIASHLNRNGFETYRGAAWRGSTVRRILKRLNELTDQRSFRAKEKLADTV